MGENIGKKRSKNLSGKCTQKLLDYAKQSATDALKTTSKKEIEKSPKAINDLIGKKIADMVVKSYNIKLQKSEKNCKKIIEEQLQINMIKKYL